MPKKYKFHHTSEEIAETMEEMRLRQFKAQVADILKPEQDDHYLTKWLKAPKSRGIASVALVEARNFDILESEKMFRESMAYRQKMRCDHILKEFEPPQVIKNYMTGGFCGHDKEGNQVRVELFGRLDIKGLMYSAKKTDLEKTKLRQCEQTVAYWKETTKKLGKRVDGLVVIFDMEGVGSHMLWKPGLDMYLHLVKVLEDNYPEMVRRMFVIHAPRVFPLFWKICRPLISEEMKQKIFVLGSNYEETLLKYIEADNLPMYLGGTLTDPDGNERCVTKICQGGTVPESYYLKELSVSVEHLKKTNLKAGGKVELEYVVETPDCVLRWEFKTDDYDVAFGLSFKKNGTVKELIPIARINCHMVPEDGNWDCKEAGTYILIFDNSFSWARGKEINYFVEIISSNVDEKTALEVDERAEGGHWSTLTTQ